MKHLPDSAHSNADSMLEPLGLMVEPTALAKMLRHLDFILEANQSINLTAITQPDDALRLHVIDSLTVLPEVESAPDGPLADIGTGAGFPGLELGIATGRTTLLVDSVRKKTEALQRFLVQEVLDSWIAVSALRAEELARQNREQFAVVTARALSSLPSLVELAAPLLFVGGRLVAMKGNLEDEELARAEKVAALVGMRFESRRSLVLPRGGETREVVVYTRCGKARIKLPRREGLAQHRPLA